VRQGGPLAAGGRRIAAGRLGPAYDSGIAERLPALANLAISNVPGPQVPCTWPAPAS
jgi:hypothetical protein